MISRISSRPQARFIYGSLLSLVKSDQNLIQKDHLSQLNLHGNLGIHHHGAALLGNRVVVHQKLPEWRDWHNYTLMQIEKNQTGPGEQGKPVILESKEKLDAAYKGFKV